MTSYDKGDAQGYPDSSKKHQLNMAQMGEEWWVDLRIFVDIWKDKG